MEALHVGPAPVRFPQALAAGGLIAVTAPSAGVAPRLHARLERTLDALRARGFGVIEGACLRESWKQVSGSAERRAAELMRFLLDPAVAAVMPPWGGELAIELLPLLDFDALAAAAPKWFTGYSDLSTLQLPLLARAGWASLHGPNLMELVEAQTDETTSAFWRVVGAPAGATIVQHSSGAFQRAPVGDWALDPDVAFELGQVAECRRLDDAVEPVSMRGRLVGGCLDTLAYTAGTAFGDVRAFARALPAGERLVVFLENAELPPPQVARALIGLKLHGWFDRVAGVLVGRSDAPDNAPVQSLAYAEALKVALGDLGCPVLVDVDIGHRPPQWSLVQGALAEVDFVDGRVRLTQWLTASADG